MLDSSQFSIIQSAFPGLPRLEAEEMATRGSVRSYPPDTHLCIEGKLEHVFFVILDGEVEVTKVINERQVRVLKHLKPGDFFGEMALIHNAPRAATVRTIGPTTVLEIHQEAFDQILQKNSHVSLAMVREVSRRLRENDEMAIEDLRIKARELAGAYQQLAELEYARHEFLSTIAHELRTPLTAANGYIQMMQEGQLQGAALPQAVGTVGRNLEMIITLVNDILFLQEMDLILQDFTPVNLGEIATSVITQQQKRAAQARIELELHVDPDLPAVQGDPKGLARVIFIFLDNAIKFSPNGGMVRVDVETIGQRVMVRVQDHGVGIPEEAMPRIFRRFFHLDEVAGHLFSGAGLGLAIARQVIEQHHGEIEVASRVGEGSTFTMYLPTI